MENKDILAKFSPMTDEEMAAYAAKAKAELLNNPEVVKALSTCPDQTKALDNSLAVLKRFCDDNKACANCSSLADCPKKTREGLQLKVKYVPYSGAFEDYSVPCPYWEKVKKVLDNFIYSDFDIAGSYQVFLSAKKYLSDPKNQTKEGSFNQVGKVGLLKVESFLKGKSSSGLYVQTEGNDGDNLIVFLAFFAASKGKKVALINAGTTLNFLSSKNTELAQGAQERLALALKADFLGVIGLGAEYKSPANRDQVLLPLLKARKRIDAITFFSSVMSEAKLIYSYSGHESGSEDAIRPYFEALCTYAEMTDLSFFNPLSAK
jgi:hypothetical protein